MQIAGGRSRVRWTRLPVLALAGAGLATAPASSQAQEVVQQLPNPASATLNEALRQLSRNPASLPALVSAGRASIALDDIDAAEGFFARARAVAPADGGVLAGMAVLAVRRLDAAGALDLFARARDAGADIDADAADHGLAFDLAGRNSEAQQRYGVALARASGGDAEIERRLALSYAIAGDGAASEATLLPLLQRRDVAAYRTRAFALAILGREEEAVSIAEAMLPARIARRMDPYLRNMGQLTAGQQAAAANLGVFPSSAEIGRESPQLARRIDLPEAPAPSGTSDARLIPGGEPLGPAQPASQPATQPAAAATVASAELPPVVIRTVDPAPVAQEVPAPSFSLAEANPVTSPPTPSSPAPAAIVPVEEVSLAEAFAGFTLPEDDRAVAAPAGAIDMATFQPRREVRPPPPPPPPPPPAPPPHPSRIWVQVATGQDVAAFRFDWRRLVRASEGVLDGREPHRARWGQTNRLLVGPFASTREANQFVTRLGEKGIDAFRFTSAAGEQVVRLD